MNSANFDGGEFTIESSWHLGSGASCHVTFDLNNLSLGSEYQGTDRVQMENGTVGPERVM